MQRHKRLTGGQSYSWSVLWVCLLQPTCSAVLSKRHRAKQKRRIKLFILKIPAEPREFQQAPAGFARFILIFFFFLTEGATPWHLTSGLIRRQQVNTLKSFHRPYTPLESNL